jgi:hypothetical protein
MRHCISGWRLAPPVTEPHNRESDAAGCRHSPLICESTVDPTVTGRNDPDGSAVGAATASRRQDIRHEGYPVSQVYPQGSVFDHLWEGCHDDRRPFSRFTPRCRHPGALVRSQDRLESRHTNDELSTTRSALPPIGLDADCSGLRPPSSRTSRHHALALPPRTQLPAGVHGSTLESLGLRARRLSPDPLGHLPPIGFCNKMSPEHATDTVQLPTALQQAA